MEVSATLLLIDWMDLVHRLICLWQLTFLSRFNLLIRPNRLIGTLRIQRWWFCCNRFCGWRDTSHEEFDCQGELFVPIATIGITPEIRVVNLGDCRTPFCHTEKGITEQSWVISDLWLWRYCNFSGKETVLQLQPQHYGLNNSSLTHCINPET